MICPSCSAENEPGTSHCIRCGASFSPVPAARPPAGGESAQEGIKPSRSLPGAPTAVGLAPTPTPSWASSTSSFSSLITELPIDFGPRYRVEALLGEGGMGAVFRAYDRDLDRTVALKLLRPGLGSDPSLTQRFKQELLLASKISHKNVLRIHDLGEANATKFISMAYIEGEDLHQLLARQGKLPVEQALVIAKQLLAALEAAHAEGVVHRDLKPQNILIDKSGHVFVSDFGLAKSLGDDMTQMTQSGQFLGTPRYMSPEQALATPVDHRSDIYSFGLILYEMVTGDVPFKAESTLQTMYLRVHEKPKSPKALNPDLPDYLVRSIMHCLETDRAGRYQDVSEILTDLESGHARPGRPSLIISLPSLSLQMPAKRSQLWTGGLVLAILLGLGIWSVQHFLLRHRNVAATVAGAALPPLSQGKYMAVLPFRVLGDQKTLGYLADGLVDAISTKLFQIKDVHLASSTALEKVRRDQPLNKIARDLGANLLLLGTVQGNADRIRITLNLLDMTGNRTLWSGDFSGMPQDLLALEDEIHSKLVTALDLKPTTEELAAGALHPTQDVEAYNLYLRGRDAMRGQQNAQNLTRAIVFFDDAIRKDSRFAMAYAGVADASMRMYGETKEKSWSEKAVAAAQKAEQLNDTLPEVHFSLGTVYLEIGRTSEAVSELKRALQIAANSDEGYRRLGEAYSQMGRYSEAVQAFEKAVQINSYYWQNYNELGLAYFSTGDYERSVAAFRRVIQLEPDNGDGYNNLGSAFLQAGEFQEAIAPLEKAIQLAPTADPYTNLGVAYFYLKQFNKAIPYYEKAVKLVPHSVVYVGNLAEAYRWAGRSRDAQATYDRAIALGLEGLQVNPRDASTMGALGFWYVKKGDTERGLKFIRQARQIDSSDVNLMYYEAQACFLAGDRLSALRALREAFSKGLRPAIAEAEPDLGRVQQDPEFKRLTTQFARK